MIDINIACTQCSAQVDSVPTIAEGSREYVRLNFDLCPDWALMSDLVCNFRRAGSASAPTYDVPVHDAQALVPVEVIRYPGFDFSLWGTDGTTHMATESIRIGVEEAVEPYEPVPPTPTIFDIILATARDAAETAQSVREDADNGNFDGEQGIQGPVGPAGPGVPAGGTTGQLIIKTADGTEWGTINSTSMAVGAVTTDRIATGAITYAKMATDSVGTPKILDTAVTTAKLADGAVTTAKMADNAVTADKLAVGAVTNGKIYDGAVTYRKMAANSIGATQLLAGAVTPGKVYAAVASTNAWSTSGLTECAISAYARGGMVTLSMDFKRASFGAWDVLTLGTLPDGYRPVVNVAHMLVMPKVGGETAARVAVTTDGVVTVQNYSGAVATTCTVCACLTFVAA